MINTQIMIVFLFWICSITELQRTEHSHSGFLEWHLFFEQISIVLNVSDIPKPRFSLTYLCMVVAPLSFFTFSVILWCSARGLSSTPVVIGYMSWSGGPEVNSFTSLCTALLPSALVQGTDCSEDHFCKH